MNQAKSVYRTGDNKAKSVYRDKARSFDNKEIKTRYNMMDKTRMCDNKAIISR